MGNRWNQENTLLWSSTPPMYGNEFPRKWSFLYCSALAASIKKEILILNWTKGGNIQFFQHSLEMNSRRNINVSRMQANNLIVNKNMKLNTKNRIVWLFIRTISSSVLISGGIFIDYDPLHRNKKLIRYSKSYMNERGYLHRMRWFNGFNTLFPMKYNNLQ